LNLLVTKRQKEVVSKKELLGIFALFTFLLVLFFPKGKIDSLVAREESNYDSSSQYLINIIHFYPQDDQPKIILVNMYLKMQRFDDARKLLKTFSADPRYANRIYRLKYNIAKASFFSNKSSVNKNAAMLEMQALLYGMIGSSKEIADFEFIRTQAQKMNFQKLKVSAETQMIRRNFLSSSEALKVYKIALYLKMSKEANIILEYEIRNSSDPMWRVLLAQKNFVAKDYGAAIKDYEAAFAHAKTKKEREKWFKELFNLHVFLKHKREILMLITNNESFIMGNDEFVKMVISYYLGNGMLLEARNFSLKLFQNKDPLED
jgi:hypothetical protein